MSRIDKKKDVPVLVPQNVYKDVLQYKEENHLSSEQAAICNLAVTAASMVSVARSLSPHYLKMLEIKSGSFVISLPGNPKAKPWRLLVGKTETPTRVHCRLSYDEWVLVSDYANALGCPLSIAVLILVKEGIKKNFGDSCRIMLQA